MDESKLRKWQQRVQKAYDEMDDIKVVVEVNTTDMPGLVLTRAGAKAYMTVDEILYYAEGQSVEDALEDMCENLDETFIRQIQRKLSEAKRVY